jgi:hypothetical protein
LEDQESARTITKEPGPRQSWYLAVCKSKEVKVLVVKKDDIEARLYDAVTRSIFRVVAAFTHFRATS